MTADHKRRQDLLELRLRASQLIGEGPGRTINAERPDGLFVCDNCQARFRNSAELVVHEARIHQIPKLSEEGEQP